jgi:hypothetical protein
MRGSGGAARGLAALLLAGGAAAGCCLTGTSPRLHRDTPQEAFAYVRAAFLEDSTRAEYDSFHPDFTKRQGISESKYALARNLSPDTFREAARILKGAEVRTVEEGAALGTERGPRAWARVTVHTTEGQGVFLLVDEPLWYLATDDEDLGPVTGPAGDVGGAVKVEGDRLHVTFSAPLPFPPKPGARVRRFEVHHDWLLYDVESLTGFEEFLRDVRKTAEKASEGKPQ